MSGERDWTSLPDLPMTRGRDAALSLPESPKMPAYDFFYATFPEILDFGTCYEGTHVQGSFALAPADKILSITLDPRAVFSRGSDTLSQPVDCGPITIGEPWKMKFGFAWAVTVNTECLGRYSTAIDIVTERGTAVLEVRVHIIHKRPKGGYVLLCESPYSCETSFFTTLSPLNVIRDELSIGCDMINVLPDDLSRYRIVVLQRCPVRAGAKSRIAQRLHQYVASGGRLVIFAGEFMEGSVQWATIF